MANMYRRRKGSDTWHFCSNCSNWPKGKYDSRTSKPTTGELCDQCKSKLRNDRCS